MSSITRVPAGEVGAVVQDFVNDGAEKIIVEIDEDGTYTITEG